MKAEGQIVCFMAYNMGSLAVDSEDWKRIFASSVLFPDIVRSSLLSPLSQNYQAPILFALTVFLKSIVDKEQDCTQCSIASCSNSSYTGFHSVGDVIPVL